MPVKRLTVRQQLNCHQMKDLKPFAKKEMGIKPGKLRKGELINAIIKKSPGKVKELMMK